MSSYRSGTTLSGVPLVISTVQMPYVIGTLGEPKGAYDNDQNFYNFGDEVVIAVCGELRIVCYLETHKLFLCSYACDHEIEVQNACPTGVYVLLTKENLRDFEAGVVKYQELLTLRDTVEQTLSSMRLFENSNQ